MMWILNAHIPTSLLRLEDFSSPLLSTGSDTLPVHLQISPSGHYSCIQPATEFPQAEQILPGNVSGTQQLTCPVFGILLRAVFSGLLPTPGYCGCL